LRSALRSLPSIGPGCAPRTLRLTCEITINSLSEIRMQTISAVHYQAMSDSGLSRCPKHKWDLLLADRHSKLIQEPVSIQKGIPSFISVRSGNGVGRVCCWPTVARSTNPLPTRSRFLPRNALSEGGNPSVNAQRPHPDKTSCALGALPSMKMGRIVSGRESFIFSRN
jgi:hypothetical protein